MATYVYETIPQKADEKPRRFELRQSMKDAAYTAHPETGEPIRRIIVGGVGFSGMSTPAPKAWSNSKNSAGGCGSSCGCHPH